MGATQVELTPLEFDLLYYLAEHARQVISRDARKRKSTSSSLQSVWTRSDWTPIDSGSRESSETY